MSIGRSNTMKMVKDKTKKVLLYAGLEKYEFESIQNNLIKMNQSSIKVLATITIVAMIIMLSLSTQSKVWTADRLLYMECLGVSIGILIVIMLGLIKSKVATLIIVYLYLSTIFLYGIAIGGTQPAQTSVSFLIFIMVGPLLFYDRPIKINVFIWVFNILFLANSIENKAPAARDTDVINGIIYGFVGCFLNTNAIVFKTKRVWLEKKMEIMAETDGLTNLKNRNYFEHHYQEYADKAKKRVTCIYIDANGLHQLNNINGHEAGDQMLKYLAEQTMLLFDQDDCYRVGGDEYMIICCDNDIDEIKQKTEKLSNRIKEQKYSVSIGIVSAPVSNLNMDELIKRADAEMYSVKKKYYEQEGIDRRN